MRSLHDIMRKGRKGVRLTCLEAGWYGTNQSILSTEKNNCNEKRHCERKVEMKQKRSVSMIVVLVLIISVVLVACNSAVNQHKTKDIVSQKSEFYFERKINTQTVTGLTTKSFDTITNKARMTFSKINYSDGSSTYIFSYTFYK